MIYLLFEQLGPGTSFSKVLRTFRARKAIHKTPTRLFSKAGLFITCKGEKIQITAQVSSPETPWFLRYKEDYATRNAPKKFRDFRETVPRTDLWYVSALIYS